MQFVAGAHRARPARFVETDAENAAGRFEFAIDQKPHRHGRGWHTAAMTMRLLVDGEFKPAGGILGVGFDELSWPRAVRPGDELHVLSEVLEVRPSKSRPDRGMTRVRNTTFNQNNE